MKLPSKTASFSLKNNRKFKVFLYFLLLTSVIWLLIQLSKSYTSSVIFKVEYKNLPVDKLLQSTPISELELAINAPGFSLLKYKAKKHKIFFDLGNISKRGKNYYFLPNAQLSYLNAQLPGEREILSVLKDTVFVELGNNISKSVPVIPNLEVKFKLGYNYIEDVQIIPDSVIITGAEKYVDSISEIFTIPVKLEEVYESVNMELVLDVPFNNDKIKLSTQTVKAIGNVDKFTEGILKIPVTIINEPEGVTINPFPKEIEVIYQVGLSNFNKINENSLSVVFDFNQYRNDTLVRYLTPVIQQKSDYIYSLKVNPSQIEFLIQK